MSVTNLFDVFFVKFKAAIGFSQYFYFIIYIFFRYILVATFLPIRVILDMSDKNTDALTTLLKNMLFCSI